MVSIIPPPIGRAKLKSPQLPASTDAAWRNVASVLAGVFSQEYIAFHARIIMDEFHCPAPEIFNEQPFRLPAGQPIDDNEDNETDMNSVYKL